MQIAVSDYDGTLGDFDGVKPEVLEAIRVWRDAGNKFGIATGRGLAMLRHELGRSHIPFDFAICCNGAAIYDQNLNLMQSREIPDAILPGLLEHPAFCNSMHYALVDEGPVRLFVRDPSTWYLYSGLPFLAMSEEEAREAKTVQQLSLAYHSIEEGEKYTTALNADFGDSLLAHQNASTLDITRKSVDKGSGIAELLQLRGWVGQKVLAIGDGENDLAMLRRYKGFTVPAANSTVKSAASRVYADVKDMLMDHLRSPHED